MRKKCIAVSLSLTLIVVLSLITSPVCYAFGGDFPEKTMIISVQELVEWYQSDVQEGFLGDEIDISGTVHLTQALGEKKLTTMPKGLRLQAGGVFILDNPQLILQQFDSVPFTVEAGGRLELRQPFTLERWIPKAPTIVIKKGGVLLGAENLPYDTVVLDENESPLPPELPPESKPPLEDGYNEIYNIFEEDFRVSFAVGEKPNLSLLPATAHVAVLGYNEAPVLPLEWDLSNVDFDVAGLYSAVGSFTQHGLDEHKLSNTKNFKMHMIIQIYEKIPPDNLRGFLLSTSSNGYTLIKLMLPALSMDKVTAVYIDRSADEVNWQQESWKGQPGTGIFQEENNFYSLVRTEGRSSMIPFRFQSNSEPVWIRVRIVGSEMEGMSNSIYLETADLPPEEVDTGDDDGMGNRGGGGQNEGDRELPKAEEKPSEVETPPTDEKLTAANTATPEQAIGSTTMPNGTPPPIGAETGTVGESGGTVPQGGSSKSKPPVSTLTEVDKEEQGVLVSSSLPKQEGEAAALEVQELSAETESSPPLQRSRGVLLTAGATAFAAGSLLLLRKQYSAQKKKP